MKDNKIGLQIKKARVEAQMTQSQLGDKIGVTWEMISRYENGKSSPRKNLEVIAEIFAKPIQYFFGVEELPINEEIQKLYNLLKKKKVELQKSADIPFIETTSGFSLSKALKLTSQTYSAPAWVFAKYKQVFAYKLDEVASDVVSIGKGDIGYFSQILKPKVGNFVLLRSSNQFVIDRFAKGENKKVHAVLLVVEKRFV